MSSNGALPDDWRTSMVTELRVARDLKISKQRLAELMAECDVQSHACDDGTRRIHGDEVPALREALSEGTGAAKDPLAQAQRHAEQVFKLYAPQVKGLLEMYKGELVAARARIRELEDELDKGRRTRDAIESEALARDLAARDYQGKEKRKAELFELVKGAAPKLLAQLGGNSAVLDLVASLEPNQLDVLLVSDFVTEKQKLLLTQIRTLLPKKTAEPATTQTEGQ